MLSTTVTNRIKSTLATVYLGAASLTLGFLGYTTTDSFLNKAKAAPYVDSANIEFWDKAFLAFDNGNCTNVQIFETAWGSKILVGSKDYLSRCLKGIGSSGYIPYVEPLTKLKSNYGPTAYMEVKTTMHLCCYVTKNQPLSYVYYSGYIAPRW